MKVIVDTSVYERNHGARPRGKGSWGFCTVNPGSHDYLNHIIWKHGKYSEAKRAAQAEAGIKYPVLYVCP